MSSIYLDLVRRLGWKGAAQHLFMFRSVKEGRLVGVDKLGNKYYENTALPWGQHRWFEPPVPEHPNLQDASAISPEWHGWMHYTHNPPVNRTVATTTGRQVAEHSDAPNKSHVVPNELRQDWRVNPTLKRERGYKAPVYQAEFQGQNAFWTQPGNPLSPVFHEWADQGKVDEVAVDAVDTSAAKRRAEAAVEAIKPVLLPKRPPTKWEKFQQQRSQLNAKEQKDAAAAPPADAAASRLAKA